MVLTGKNQNTWRKTCPSVTLSISNPTQTSLEPDCIHSERAVTNYPSHDAAVVFLPVITVVSKDPFECLKICLIRDRLVC